MATTYELIASVTLGSDAADIEFTSIPATHDDLLVVYSFRGAGAFTAYSCHMRFNGAVNDTNHSSRRLRGSGSAADSSSESVCHIGYASADSATSSTFGSGEIYIPNYTGSTNKTYSAVGVSETNAATAYISVAAGLWSDTSAITAINLYVADQNLKSGSSAYLYGITKA